MILLGLSTMGNSAACIFKDNKIIAAIEEERLSRIKNDGAFPIRSIKECLRHKWKLYIEVKLWLEHL